MLFTQCPKIGMSLAKSDQIVQQTQYNDVAEATAMLLILGKLILNIYAAESRTTDCRKFGTHGPLSTAYKLFCSQSTKAYVAETS